MQIAIGPTWSLRPTTGFPGTSAGAQLGRAEEPLGPVSDSLELSDPQSPEIGQASNGNRVQMLTPEEIRTFRYREVGEALSHLIEGITAPVLLLVGTTAPGTKTDDNLKQDEYY